jgi:hypothetical protein
VPSGDFRGGPGAGWVPSGDLSRGGSGASWVPSGDWSNSGTRGPGSGSGWVHVPYVWIKFHH